MQAIVQPPDEAKETIMIDVPVAKKLIETVIRDLPELILKTYAFEHFTDSDRTDFIMNALLGLCSDDDDKHLVLLLGPPLIAKFTLLVPALTKQVEEVATECATSCFPRKAPTGPTSKRV